MTCLKLIVMTRMEVELKDPWAWQTERANARLKRWDATGWEFRRDPLSHAGDHLVGLFVSDEVEEVGPWETAYVTGGEHRPSLNATIGEPERKINV